MEKYVIDSSTLAAIADAIRAKGGTSAEMSPDEMAALIEAIKASNAKASTGTFTPSGSQVYTVSLGQALDLSGNYCLIIINTVSGAGAASGVNAGYTSNWNGTKRHRTNDRQGGVTKSWTITANGSITIPEHTVNNVAYGSFVSGSSYAWLFLAC